MFRPYLALVGMLIASSWTVSQSTNAASLHEYSYPADALAISAPFAPDIHPDAQVPDVTVYRWQLSPDVVLVIHVGIRPDCSTVLLRMKDVANSKDIGAKTVALNDAQGVETDTSQDGRRTLEQVYCAAERAYALTAEWPQDRPVPDTVKIMFKSFLIGRTAAQ